MRDLKSYLFEGISISLVLGILGLSTLAFGPPFWELLKLFRSGHNMVSLLYILLVGFWGFLIPISLAIFQKIITRYQGKSISIKDIVMNNRHFVIYPFGWFLILVFIFYRHVKAFPNL